MTDSRSTGSLDALQTFERLREAFFRYYDTPFGLADDRLQLERRRLLDRDGGVFRQPLLEIRPEYATTGKSLTESVAASGAAHELAEFAAAGLIPEGRQLYQHQEEALREGVAPGKHMVITAGTGSGKTESFLLPVLSSLLEESRAWTGEPGRPSAWWRADSGEFADQRRGETGRRQAVRAIVLYPMNALVDDQLIRLRRALDSDTARAWLDANRSGHRFYFGRYTGATPVTGSPQNAMALRELRRYLQETEQRGARAREISGRQDRDDTQYFVPRLDGAEMRSRWDMAAAPPDILVTNYSMLNVMLMRARDDRFFDSTRQWLEEDPRNRFTLVVDELHTYRGTAGTEVAYLLRALKHRLGLDRKPDQLRVLAASASLDPNRDRAYLQEFFDTDPNTFAFINGSNRKASSARTGTEDNAEHLATGTPPEAAVYARRNGLTDVLRAAFENSTGTSESLTADEAAARMFPQTPAATAVPALEALLSGLAADPAGGDPRFRAHLFFRNVPGMWACTDPRCPEIPGGAYGGRTVGRLHAEPTSRCGCGSRVLELLYCQNCGDVMLGGFSPEGATQHRSVDTMLLADVPELAKLPDQVKLERTADNYLVYWPRASVSLTEPDRTEWDADYGNVHYAFRRALLVPASGELRNTREDATGWSFHAVAARKRNGELRRAPRDLSPFPTKCPACGDDWEIRHGQKGPLPHTDPRRQRSPIRHMRTGFEKINQVLTTELASEMRDSERKVIVFTDSRQDAAKLSAGLGLRHYQDLLRQLLYSSLQNLPDPASDVDLARAHFREGRRTDESWEAVRRLRERGGRSFQDLCDIWEHAPGTDGGDGPRLAKELGRLPSITELADGISDELLAMGVNPGGPYSRLQATEEKLPVPWSSLYDWKSTPHRPRPRLNGPQRELLAEIRSSLQDELLEGLFSGAGRDFESLGLGWLALDDDIDPVDAPSPENGQARAALRILAHQRRFTGLREGRPDAPRNLRGMWNAIEDQGGPSAEELRDALEKRVGGAIREYLIDPGRVVIRQSSGRAWRCARCLRQHLTTGNGRCTKCFAPLPTETEAVDTDQDYYAWKASSGQGRFRLHCAELTGQTDRTDAQARQARFQDVFLTDGENPKTDAVDLLSVTTTMEAGVDIGALSAVVLGNMPPTRFNYQQRVGRAGRRDSPVAVALTVCRGRSHDEYYFNRPEKITSDPTPAPYLALDRPEIFQRSLRSEILRAASREIFGTDDDLAATANAHGAFGRTEDWPRIRPRLQEWLSRNEMAVAAAAAALARQTAFAPNTEVGARACAGGLVGLIDRAVGGPGHEELSQRLAECGVLPMFGFPTSVRYLHLYRPKKSYPWPPHGVIDRDLAMAVSQFSPLSEIVKDGRVHTVVGVAAYRPTGGAPAAIPDPLGIERRIVLCGTCSYLATVDETGSREDCPQCGAGPARFKALTLREPHGFRSGRAKDFDGNFSWTPRSVTARAVTDLAKLESTPHAAAQVFSGPGDQYIINDNGGQQFAFLSAAAPADGRGPDWGGYVAQAAVDADLIPASYAVGDPISVALAAVRPTDFMFLGPQHPVDTTRGLRLNLSSGKRQPSGAAECTDGRRAAWYSLAFLNRTIAAAHLDVQPQELTAGIYSGDSGGQPTVFAFLADTLENGAGFSTHLGAPEELPRFLDAAEAFLDQLETPGHAGECGTSCYQCLRDYGNMAYHALLDWRLARDLHRVLTGSGLKEDVGRERQAIAQWAQAYDAERVPDLGVAAAVFDKPRYGRYVVLAKHPLEASETALIAPRLAAAADRAARLYPDVEGVLFVDTFTLDRDPRRVLEMMEETASSDRGGPRVS